MIKTCKLCGEQFTNDLDKKKHKYALHLKKVQCPKCNKILNTQKALEDHLVKTVPCDFTCRHCGKEHVGKNARGQYDYHMRKEHNKMTKADMELHNYGLNYQADNRVQMKKKTNTNISNVNNSHNTNNQTINNFININNLIMDRSQVTLDFNTPTTKQNTKKMMMCLGKNDTVDINTHSDMEKLKIEMIEKTCVDPDKIENTIFRVMDNDYDTLIKEQDGWKHRTIDQAHELFEKLASDIVDTLFSIGLNALQGCLFTRQRKSVIGLMYQASATLILRDAILIYIGHYYDEKLGKFDLTSPREFRTMYIRAKEDIKMLPESDAINILKLEVTKRKEEVKDAVMKMVMSKEIVKEMLDKTKDICFDNILEIETRKAEKLLETEPDPLAHEPVSFDLIHMSNENKILMCEKYLLNVDDTGESTSSHIIDQYNFFTAANNDPYCSNYLSRQHQFKDCMSVKQTPNNFGNILIKMLNI